MKDILEVVIKNLVDNQDEVSITEKTEAKTITYEVKVDGFDKVTYIDTRPDGAMIDKIVQFPTARMTTSYTADGLYHYVYNITI